MYRSLYPFFSPQLDLTFITSLKDKACPELAEDVSIADLVVISKQIAYKSIGLCSSS